MTFWTIFAAAAAGMFAYSFAYLIIKSICRVLISRHYDKKEKAERNKKVDEALLQDIQVENAVAKERINSMVRLKTECGDLINKMEGCYRKSFVAMQLEPEKPDARDLNISLNEEIC